MTKTKAIYIRITEEEKKRIVECASKSGHTICSFIRWVVLKFINEKT
jgi:predicted DNA-binding protein